VNSKPPEFLSNLFADLRARKLLPVVGILVVCVFAAPFLLGGGGGDGGSPPPPVATAATTGGVPGIETSPVVIASPAELRNYHKRLDTFNARNPFHQDLNGAGGGNGGQSATAAVATDSATSGQVPPTSTSPGASTDPIAPTAPGPTAPLGTDPTTPADTTTPADSTTPSDSGSTTTKLISIRIDVRAGQVGKTKRIDDVRALDFLPDPQHPVVEFIGGDFSLTKAAFVVSSGVTSTDGDGKCAPSPDNCQFLMLKVGDQQAFTYRDERYRLKLAHVNRHETDVTGSDPGTGTSAGGGTGKVPPSNRDSGFGSFGPLLQGNG
jgi:hypothetical protein